MKKTTRNTPMSLVKTNSWTYKLKNSSKSIQEKRMLNHLMNQPLILNHQEMLIGEPKVLSVQLKIKDNVAHVGHSVALVAQNQLIISLFKKPCLFTQSNNQLTAHNHMETKVAMEDQLLKLINMLLITELSQKLNIHTLLKTKHAKLTKVQPKLRVSQKLLLTTVML